MARWLILVMGLWVFGCGSESGDDQDSGGSSNSMAGSTQGPNTSSSGGSSAGGGGSSNSSVGSSSAADRTAFVQDATFVSLLCDAFKQVCDCNADQTDCPGNSAAIALYDCLWYAADADDSERSGISDNLREIESTNERLCRTLDTPIATCNGRFTTVFRSDGPRRENIWDFLDPKPTNPQALIDACQDVPPAAQ
ncbi:MAG TPA: hypothetical protein VHO25_19920 [Polyangiaceae bacterium]|nr:hypothetical protein [Polyangiaceae bacterium]